ncbi:sprT domain-containing protein [Polaribacter sp.]|nr:sprT domain-containing protein [Polaribacter sp.]
MIKTQNEHKIYSKKNDWHNYIPSKAIPFVQFLVDKHNFELKIVNQRQTKHGDFRVLANKQFQITINNNLNPHQFLLTLVHEIAHHVTHQKFGSVQPHGREWKMVFQHLMLPFLTSDIYPLEILPYLARYLKNPKASTDSDTALALALKGNRAEKGKNFVFELPENSFFEFKNTIYQRGKQKRTRIECKNMNNSKLYLFNKNVEIKKYEK